MKIGLTTLLFCIFLTLKLCSVIDWSWWWVCAPLWIPLAIAVIMACLMPTTDEDRSKARRTLSSWERRMEQMRKEREELIRQQNKTK